MPCNMITNGESEISKPEPYGTEVSEAHVSLSRVYDAAWQRQ